MMVGKWVNRRDLSSRGRCYVIPFVPLQEVYTGTVAEREMKSSYCGLRHYVFKTDAHFASRFSWTNSFFVLANKGHFSSQKMGDGSLVHELKRWATKEFNLPSQRLPNDGYFKTWVSHININQSLKSSHISNHHWSDFIHDRLCVGSGASIWKYMVQHVYQQR